jgi:spore germination cell wall hydrolase CwlJ-like protein
MLYTTLMPFFYTCLAVLLSLFFSAISKGSEHRIVAQTILAEARGDGRAGMYAVAACIKVRAQKRNLSFKQVCLQPYQFSCWNKNDPNRKKMDMLLTLPQAEYAWQLARNMDKVNTEAINKADHYMTVKLWKTGTVKWARGQKPVAFWGSHVFFRLR